MDFQSIISICSCRQLLDQDTLYISAKTFWLAGGVRLVNAHDVTLQLDGTLEFREGASARDDTLPAKHVKGKFPNSMEVFMKSFVIVNLCIYCHFDCISIII